MSVLYEWTKIWRCPILFWVITKQDIVIEPLQQVSNRSLFFPRFFFHLRTKKSTNLRTEQERKTFFICVVFHLLSCTDSRSINLIFSFIFFCFLLDRSILVGKFACIEVHLALQRNINLYLQQLYLPSTLIVALSFIAFWIDYKSHPARTLLSLLSIVTVTTKAEGTMKIPFLFDIYLSILCLAQLYR